MKTNTFTIFITFALIMCVGLGALLQQINSPRILQPRSEPAKEGEVVFLRSDTLHGHPMIVECAAKNENETYGVLYLDDNGIIHTGEIFKWEMQ